MSQLEAALGVALDAVEAARTILLAECARPDGPRGEIGRCPADDESEWAIREVLLRAYPRWGFLGEETGSCTAAERERHVWFVDPNDGTTTMQRGYRGHAISIGLVRDGVPVLGVVCAVDAPDDEGDLIVWAEGCGPIRRNGVALQSRTWPDALRPHDLVGVSQAANRNPVGYLACVTPSRFVGVPSIAYRLALVAVGEHVATASLNFLSAWDYAAGHALIRAAGGVVVDEHGADLTYPAEGRGTTSQLFAGGRAVVDELLRRPWDRVSRSGFGEAAPPPEAYPVRAVPGKLVHAAGVLSRAQGCILGQLAGDALGALVEFESASSIAASYPDGGPRVLADGGPYRITAGQPTDDSELALALARSLIARGDFDLEAVAARYAAWYHGWTHSDEPVACSHAWCRPFDVGATTAQALGAIRADDVQQGKAASRARAAANPDSQANGALMRISPLGIWGALRDPDLVAAAARDDASLTHPHPVCQDVSAVFAVTLAAAIRDGLSPVDTHAFALHSLHQASADESVLQAVARANSDPPTDFQTAQGWVLVALQNAFYQLLHASSLEEGLVATVRAGGDTDTNAAICGALLGAIHGRAAIPNQWQAMVLSCRPMPAQPTIAQPRPALCWPTDALTLAERLLLV